MLLVRWRDLSRPVSAENARAFLSKATAGKEPLAEEEIDRIAAGLESGELRLVRVEERPRLMDAPEIRDLRELAPSEPLAAPEEEQNNAWVAVEVLDETGRLYPNLQVEFQVEDGGRRTVSLDGRAQCRIDVPNAHGECLLLVTDFLEV